MLNKKNVFVVFSDLDSTFTPIGLDGVRRFVDLMKEISEKEKVEVKFCPISGRPADYVVGLMNMIKYAFEEKGMKNVVEYGAGEQGGVVVDSSKAYSQVYVGDEKNKNLKEKIMDLINESKYAKYVADEPGKRYTCSIHIKSEYECRMTNEQQKKVYNGIRELMMKEFGNRVCCAMASDCIEVMPTEISKHNAMKYLMQEYNKKYDIVGITYSGDAENDKKAVDYVSRIAEIPGIQASVFLPGNSNKCIHSSELESWKERLNGKASNNRIITAERSRFDGVMDLMEKSLKEGKLIGKGRKFKHTVDDCQVKVAIPNKIGKENRNAGIKLSI